MSCQKYHMWNEFSIGQQCSYITETNWIVPGLGAPAFKENQKWESQLQ